MAYVPARKPKQTLTVNVELVGAKETLAAFRRLPKQASEELREAAMRIAADMAGWIRKGAAETLQSWLMEPTIKVVKDRVPAVTVGGAQRVGSRKTKAYRILFGANFGSRFYHQFRPWAGKGKDYFIFSPIDTHAAEISRDWGEAADRIIRRWEQDGDGISTIVMRR